MTAPIGENEDAVEGGGDYDSEMADEADDAVEYYETEEDGPMDLVLDEPEELRRDAAGLDEVDPEED